MATPIQITQSATIWDNLIRLGDGKPRTLFTNQAVTKWADRVPANAVDFAVALSVTIADVVAMGLIADAPGVVVKVNATSEPDVQLDLVAQLPLIWTSSHPLWMRFINTNIAHLYISTGSRAANVRFGAALD